MLQKGAAKRVASSSVATVATVAEVADPSIKSFETFFSPINKLSNPGGECAPQALATATVATLATVGRAIPAKPLQLGEMEDYGLRADPVDPESLGKPFGWKGSIFAGLGFFDAAAKPAQSLTPVMLAASQAQDASVAAVGPNAAPDPNRHCFPHSAAMTGAEIDTFTARLSRITDKGVSLTDGEAMADKMLFRDRQAGDWFSCLECAHLGG